MKELIKTSETNRNIYPYIHCTISAYNILYIKEIIDWARELSHNPPHVSFNLLHEPELQHISVLTKKLKQKAIDRLNKIKQNYNLSKTEQNGVDSCLAILNSSLEDTEKTVELRKQLKEHTLCIDRWRNEDFFQFFRNFKEAFL